MQSTTIEVAPARLANALKGRTTIVTACLASLVGSVFSDMNEALTYAYMGTHWSFVVALLFGFGLDRPYLWAGQKTPGSWEDVD